MIIIASIKFDTYCMVAVGLHERRRKFHDLPNILLHLLTERWFVNIHNGHKFGHAYLQSFFHD